MLSPLFLATLVVLAASSQQQLTPDQCKERLAGKWEADLTPSRAIVMEIKDDTLKLFSIVRGKGLIAWTGKMSISNARPASHLDWKDRKNANGPLPDNQCLYRITGDTLLLIGGGPDKRPSKFLSGAGDEPKTIVFTRMPNDR